MGHVRDKQNLSTWAASIAGEWGRTESARSVFPVLWKTSAVALGSHKGDHQDTASSPTGYI